MSDYKAVASPWARVTGPHAFCVEPPCLFYYHGDQDPSAHRTMNAARLHVEETGHEVIVQEGRSRWVKPKMSTYPND